MPIRIFMTQRQRYPGSGSTSASGEFCQVIAFNSCHRSADDQGENKILEGQGKVREFYFEPGKIEIITPLIGRNILLEETFRVNAILALLIFWE